MAQPQMLEIENRTRQIFRFTKPQIGEDGAVYIDHKQDLVIGSKKDAELPKGISHGPLCPAPVVRIEAAELDALGERNLAVFNSLVKAEKLRVRKVA